MVRERMKRESSNGKVLETEPFTIFHVAFSIRPDTFSAGRYVLCSHPPGARGGAGRGLAMTDGSKNLTVPRGERSVWDEAPRRHWSDRDVERWVMAGGGGALAFFGARLGGLAGGALAALGGTLAVRAAMGHHDVRIARHWLERTLERQGWMARDRVQNASEASFPASDAPAWTGVD